MVCNLCWRKIKEDEKILILQYPRNKYVICKDCKKTNFIRKIYLSHRKYKVPQGTKIIIRPKELLNQDVWK